MGILVVSGLQTRAAGQRRLHTNSQSWGWWDLKRSGERGEFNPPACEGSSSGGSQQTWHAETDAPSEDDSRARSTYSSAEDEDRWPEWRYAKLDWQILEAREVAGNIMADYKTRENNGESSVRLDWNPKTLRWEAWQNATVEDLDLYKGWRNHFRPPKGSDAALLADELDRRTQSQATSNWKLFDDSAALNLSGLCALQKVKDSLGLVAREDDDAGSRWVFHPFPGIDPLKAGEKFWLGVWRKLSAKNVDTLTGLVNAVVSGDISVDGGTNFVDYYKHEARTECRMAVGPETLSDHVREIVDANAVMRDAMKRRHQCRDFEKCEHGQEICEACIEARREKAKNCWELDGGKAVVWEYGIPRWNEALDVFSMTPCENKCGHSANSDAWRKVKDHYDASLYDEEKHYNRRKHGLNHCCNQCRRWGKLNHGECCVGYSKGRPRTRSHASANAAGRSTCAT